MIVQSARHRPKLMLDPAGDLLSGKQWRNAMNRIKLVVLAAGLLTALPALAQTAGGTQNTGPQGTGNFVAGKPEGTGNPVAGQTGRMGTPVAGKPEGTGNPVAGQPADKMEKK
jgi:hypothetical protein